MNEKTYATVSDYTSTWNGDTVYRGMSEHYCKYELRENETYHCETSLEKKLYCDGKDSETSEELKHVVEFRVKYVVNPEKFKKNDYKDFCSGKKGWRVDRNMPVYGDYSDIPEDYLRTYYVKYYDNQIRVHADAGNRFAVSIDPEAIESQADKIAEKIPGIPCGQEVTENKGCKNDETCPDSCKCEGECMPDEPFADEHGCVDTICNKDGKIDADENCRYCDDTSCEGQDSICVPYDGRWTCLGNARTYATIKDMDEGSVFVRRWVEREVEVPLKTGDRLMDGDEIILHRWPNRNMETYVEIRWDDGKIGAASFNHHSGERFGSFFIGESRNESVIANADYDYNNNVIGIENTQVFPDNPTLIEMYGDDAVDISLQVLTNLPIVLPQVSIGSTILLSPTKTTDSMTYIKVNSDILLEPAEDKTWTLYTFEGAPEVVRVEDGEEVDSVTVNEGEKAIVSQDDGAKSPEEFNTNKVDGIIRQNSMSFWPWIIGIVILIAAIYSLKKRLK